MENIKSDYLQMYEIYKALNEHILPHIKKVKIFNAYQINKFFDIGNTITNKLEKDALSVYEKLPKETKCDLKNRYEQNNDVLNNYYCHMWRMCKPISYIDRCINYLYYSGLVNICLLNTNFIFGDGLKMKVIKYDLLPNGYKKLNDILFYHINGTQYLYEYEIEYIISAIRHIFATLNSNALKCCDYTNEIQKYKIIEDYFNAPISINEDCSMTDNDIILLKEHNAWKAERIKYLQRLFYLNDETFQYYKMFPYDEDFPCYEAFFVRNKMMYNEDY